MSASDQTANDMFGSLTGFDEIAIRKEFRSDVYSLSNDGPAFLRALIYVDHRRQGIKDADAYKAAMEMTQAEATDYFAPEPDDKADDDLGEA